MMRGKWSKWVGGVGLVALIGGLVLTNYGGGMKPAEAHGYYHNPFKVIIGKLNDILAKLNNGGAPSSGGSTTPGNYTTRWDTRHAAATRFTVLAEFNGAAVRDNNTGLVWEQAPSTLPINWSDARLQCIDKAVGGTRGWRLPSVAELASVMDPSLAAPYVPNVFTGVEQMAPYWSATSNADSNATSPSATKFSMNFQDGRAGISAKSASNFFWCVRGSMNESSY